jgi:hypothetical protein
MTGEFRHKTASIRQATSQAADPAMAARELHGKLAGSDLALVLFFCSPEYETPALAAELGRLFSGVLVVGCTTAGEIGCGGYHDNSIVAVSFARPEFEAVGTLLTSLAEIGFGRSSQIVADLRQELYGRLEGQPTNPFALVLIDSTSRCEDQVMSYLGRALADMPIIGGSAGNGMRFERTSVYFDGRFHTDSAVLLLLATTRRIKPFRHQYFVASSKKLVVTGADPARRLVTELDAEPAVEAYARMVGCPVEDLTPMMFATHPLVVRLGAEEYVRSIQKANADGSLNFHCAIDEGLVLTLAEACDFLGRLDDLFDQLRREIGAPEVVIGFDCILNRLQAERDQTKLQVSRLLKANNVIGFSTFGDQFGSMHVNQTFTGIAIGQAGGP